MEWIRTPLPEVKAVIFDFNGTLFLDNDKHVQAWGEVSQALRGQPLSEEELYRYCNGRPNHMIVRYLNGGKEDPTLEAKYSLYKEEIYRRLCQEDQANFHLIQGAHELFETLKEKNIPFTIASASIKENIDFFVKSFHLDQWIDPSTICYDDGSYPSKKEMLQKACTILNTSPEQTTILEDSLSGIQAAQAIGIQDIRLIDSAHQGEEFKKLPHVYQIANTMEEILKTMEQSWSQNQKT